MYYPNKETQSKLVRNYSSPHNDQFEMKESQNERKYPPANERQSHKIQNNLNHENTIDFVHRFHPSSWLSTQLFLLQYLTKFEKITSHQTSIFPVYHKG